MKTSMTRLLLVGPALLALSALEANATLIAYENFDYGGGVNLTTETANNGTGWTAAWSTTGVNGLVTSGTGQSLGFTQSPALITDGSTHVFSDASKGNTRNFSPTVDLATSDFFFTALVRDFDGGATVGQMRVQFHDGTNASGNMRAVTCGQTSGSTLAPCLPVEALLAMGWAPRLLTPLSQTPPTCWR